MTPDPAFRFSTYLALGLACAALGAAEFPVLPEVGAFAAVVVAALAVVYRLETRVELLSLGAANNVGVGIALAGAAWAAVRVVREARTGEFAALGWGVFFVLLLAPVLMAALVAKLLRRDKDAGDYWYLHAAALAAVVLAAAIARRPAEVALLAGYAAAAVWGLARFARVRGGVAGAGGRRAGAAAAAGWLLAAAAAATPVFALTPASPFEKWEFGPGRLEVGLGPDQTVDLTRTGELSPGPDLAFTVTADEGGRPKDDLPAGTRWRGRVLTHYAAGGWRRETTYRFPLVGDPPDLAGAWAPPALGPGAYRLRFAVPAGLRADVLAEPVVWAPRQPAPVADVFAPPLPPRPWYALPDGTFLRTPGRADHGPTLEYVQYTAPLPDPDAGVGFHLIGRVDDVLTTNPVPGVRAFADRLLARLIAEGKLPPAAGARNAVSLHPPGDQHEAVARAFTRYLSESPEFTYTTTLTRTRPDLDPLEEFLDHTKTGHCNRFASALVLLLRAEGIPAALVIGFKGHEPAGDGKYVVRHDHAHAWATAFVSRPDGNGGREWHWLSLDPSPVTEDAAGGPAAGPPTGWAWVRGKLLDASPPERLKALAELAGSRAAVAVVAGLAGLLAAGWGFRRVLRTRRPAGGNPWLAPLLRVLAGAGFTPAAGETPREFAARVAAALAARPGTAGVAAVPPAWAAWYYGERFGGTPDPARRAVLAAGLADLRAALAAPADRTPMTKNPRRPAAENSALLVVDIQDKLLAKLPHAAALVRSAAFVLDVAALLDIPIRATEQYPKGLGPTTPEIARRLPVPPDAKTAFSCCGCGTLLEDLKMLQRPTVVLVGMETHVCVQQTALDLLDAGLHVVVPADAVAAWADLDHATALRRLEHAGAVVTTAEALAFEWLRDSTHAQFKAVSALVVARRA